MATVLVGTADNEAAPAFSPDGRWIAYTSDEAGKSCVYVRPFPGPGGPWRVTTERAVLPHWSPSTRELLFLDLESPKDSQFTLMVAPYSVVGESFRAEKPRPWSPVRIGGWYFDVHPDGKRVVVLAPRPQQRVQEQVVFVSNFFESLRAIAPGPK